MRLSGGLVLRLEREKDSKFKQDRVSLVWKRNFRYAVASFSKDQRAHKASSRELFTFVLQDRKDVVRLEPIPAP